MSTHFPPMLRFIAVTVAASLLACPAADARSAKAKAKLKPAYAGQSTHRVAARTAGDGWNAFPGYPDHRDRSTIYHPNGKLNGQELFDSINDRAGSAGE